MTCFRVARYSAVLFLLCLGFGGCLPSGDSQSDESKEPHFLRGKSLVTQSDFKGAVEAFEEALKVNPDSASAHYELAVLYENRDVVADPAAAIYHYQRFLHLRPRANNADVVNTHIGSCKLELSRSVSALPLTPSMQRDFDRLLNENRDLKIRLAQWEAAYNALRVSTVAPTNAVVTNRVTPIVGQRGAMNPVRPATPVETARAVPAAPPGSLTPTNRVASTPATRTHAVQSGEIPATIARRYGVSVEALLAANPQVNPRRLKIGQILSIPKP